MKQIKTSVDTHSQLVRKPVIFSFFGPPGSGKGTLAQILVQKKLYTMLSTGNLCRWHVAQGTEFGHLLDEYLKRGHLIPDALVTDMVVDWLKQHMGTSSCSIILDGFPRTEGQARLLLDYFRSEDAPVVTFRVILFKVPDQVIIDRLTMRVVCSNKKCQASLSIKENLKICKFCGGELVQRSDDKKDVVIERLAHYPAYRDALLSFYKKEGQEVEVFDIDDQPSEVVFDQFISLADK